MDSHVATYTCISSCTTNLVYFYEPFSLYVALMHVDGIGGFLVLIMFQFFELLKDDFFLPSRNMPYLYKMILIEQQKAPF